MSTLELPDRRAICPIITLRPPRAAVWVDYRLRTDHNIDAARRQISVDVDTGHRCALLDVTLRPRACLDPLSRVAASLWRLGAPCIVDPGSGRGDRSGRHARDWGRPPWCAPGTPHPYLAPARTPGARRAFPGFTAQVLHAGAEFGDTLGSVRSVLSGYRLRQADIGLPTLFSSRPLLEGQVRARVRALPGITLTQGTDIAGLTMLTPTGAGSPGHLRRSRLTWWGTPLAVVRGHRSGCRNGDTNRRPGTGSRSGWAMPPGPTGCVLVLSGRTRRFSSPPRRIRPGRLPFPGQCAAPL